MIHLLKSLKKPKAALITALSFLSFSGCDSFRHTLGLDHYQPDEFKVSENPPLSIPKDYNLRPPSTTPSSSTTQETNLSTQQAQKVLVGKGDGVSSSSTRTDANSQTLVNQASGGQAIDATIRDVVDKEAANQEKRTALDDKLEEIARNATSLNQEKKPVPVDQENHKAS